MKTPQIYLGYDPRETEAYAVARNSIIKRCNKPMSIIPLDIRHMGNIYTRPIEYQDGKMWCPISNAPMSTEFAISRFAIPFLQKTGWALFADCDILCLSDITELFALAEDKYAVMVVKHSGAGLQPFDFLYDERCELIDPANPREAAFFIWPHELKFPNKDYFSLLELLVRGSPFKDFDKLDSTLGLPWKLDGNKIIDVTGRHIFEVANMTKSSALDARLAALVSRSPFKMDGQAQTYYSRKNWSSVVLWNCEHPANQNLTHTMLNTLPGRDLHAFCWLQDDEIGELPQHWNWLINVTPGEPQPKGIWHFTLGGAWFPEWTLDKYDKVWLREKSEK